ncbi:3'-5' exonuclease [Nocardiopsis terrae]|uniref:DNA polymerase-3 subunit epsilon n=1 Tax=Nocardiopsis terrae TaxID=372655 RepID=A0ABR9HL84_9ACTN|nr:exonuclease domain-containing protein [Nocardiopsis terrae]MBE1459769.1 DNA polymerase-3 subunit epsilon [Nocardiopsis terrae]GHC94074.1 3'-5' exonuclease [Nocardiopsis terrae]
MNTPWHHLPMAAFDVETTGLDVESDRIITAALWRIDPARGTKEVATWFADPGIEIPAEAAEIHGITTEQARAQGRPAADVVTEIAAALDAVTAEGLPVVVYNAPYDLTLLDRELALHRPGAPLAAQPLVVDPLVLDKRVDTFRRGSRKLVDVCAHYEVPLAREEAHGAAADALASARLAWRIAAANPEIAQMSAVDLHAAQVKWKAEQAASFQEYLRRRNPEAVVDGSWPLVPAAT